MKDSYSYIKKSVYLSLATLFTSLFSFANQIAISYYYGISVSLTLYLMISAFPVFLSGWFASGMNYSLLPNILKNIQKSATIGRFNIFPHIFLFFLISILGFSITIIFFNNRNSSLVIVVVWLTFFLTLVFNLFLVILNGFSKYLIGSVGNIVLYVFSIIPLITFSIHSGLVLSMSIFIGTLSASVFLFLYCNKWQIIKICIEIPELNKVIRLFIETVSSSLFVSIFAVVPLIDSVISKHLGNDVLSELNYSYKFVTAIGSVLIAGPFVVYLPRLTSLYNINISSFFLHFFKLSAFSFLFLSFSLFCVLYNLEGIIKFIYLRGKFDSSDLSRLLNILPYYLVGSLYSLSSAILFRGFFILKWNKISVFIGILFTSVYIIGGVLSVILAPTSTTIAFFYSFSWYITFCFGFILTFKNSRIPYALFLSYLIASTTLFPLFLFYKYLNI